MVDVFMSVCVCVYRLWKLYNHKGFNINICPITAFGFNKPVCFVSLLSCSVSLEICC